MTSNPVYIGVEHDNPRLPMIVKEPHDYQLSAYETFMSNDNAVEIHFEYPGDRKFRLYKYNAGDSQEEYYKRFCMLENANGKNHILSDNEEKLRNVVALRNRFLEPVGGSKRKSTKRKPVTKIKSTKRKPVTKKKSIKKQ